MSETTTMITTVAAQPGWFIATILCADDEDEGELVLDPIVAWEIARTAPLVLSPGCTGEWDISRGVTPIALNNNDFREQGWAIKSPDGKFDIFGDQICDDEAETLARLRRRAR